MSDFNFSEADFDRLFPTEPQPQAEPAGPSAAELAAMTNSINQKDALIDQMRQVITQRTGFDPITGQQVGQAQRPVDYTQDRQKYMEDLYEAAKTSPDAYVDVQQKFVMDTLGPLAPLVTKVSREQAVQTLAKEIPDAGKFVGTPAYQSALASNPELQNAIAVAESDPKWSSRLPGLYKLAYLSGAGMQATGRMMVGYPQE